MSFGHKWKNWGHLPEKKILWEEAAFRITTDGSGAYNMEKLRGRPTDNLPVGSIEYFPPETPLEVVIKEARLLCQAQIQRQRLTRVYRRGGRGRGR
jgi:hypothetical protein